MINFFRRIRQKLFSENKFSKYLIYALGEIILVVIGILIALQINNWNEQRKAIIQEKALLANLVTSIESDKERFTENLNDAYSILNVYKQLYQIGSNISNDSIIDNPNYVRKMLRFDPNMNQDFSKLSDKITNGQIKNALLEYDYDLNNFEAEYLEFRIVIERIRIFLGEKGIYQLENLYTTDDLSNVIFVNLEKLIELSKTVEFQQLMFEAKMKLEFVKIRLQQILNQNNELKVAIDKNIIFY